MKLYPYQNAAPHRATAGSPKQLSPSTTPQRPHRCRGRLGRLSWNPGRWLLLLILLCPLAAAVGAGIPDPGDPGPTNTNMQTAIDDAVRPLAERIATLELEMSAIRQA